MKLTRVPVTCTAHVIYWGEHRPYCAVCAHARGREGFERQEFNRADDEFLTWECEGCGKPVGWCGEDVDGWAWVEETPARIF